jgi:hypothetical protein
MAKLRRALVHGAPARFWKIRDELLVLRHPSGHDWTEVPIAHLHDDREFEGHLNRLMGKHWISTGQIDELIEIRNGAGR